jgi:hypothetical protein
MHRLLSLLLVSLAACGGASMDGDATAMSRAAQRLSRVIRTTRPGTPSVVVHNITVDDPTPDLRTRVTFNIDADFVRSQPGLAGFQMNGAAFFRMPVRDDHDHIFWSEDEEPEVPRLPNGLFSQTIVIFQHTVPPIGENQPPIALRKDLNQLGVAVSYRNTLGDFWLQEPDHNFRPDNP